MRLFRAVLLAALSGLAAPAAWAQGCCLAVRPGPAPGPSLRLDATAPPPARLRLGDTFGQAAALLPFMQGGAGAVAPAGTGATLTFSAPIAAGEGQVSLSLGVRNVEPELRLR